jgi:hypothetical protein
VANNYFFYTMKTVHTHTIGSECKMYSGQDCIVGIVTGYGLDGLGVKSHWGRDFLHLSRLVLGHTQLPVLWVVGHSWGVKWPGCGGNHPPPSSAKVNEIAELYLYSTSVSSWHVTG